MNYIFYQTKTKFTNTGDALINNSLLSVLRSYGKIKANCGNDIPKEFIQQLGINEDEKLSGYSEFNFIFAVLKYAIKAKRKGDKVFIFSGLGHTYGGSLKKVIRNLIAGILFPIYKLFGVKVIRIGITLGPISHLLALTEVFRSFFIYKYLVRDTASLNLCHKIGIKKAELCPDMSWLYKINTSRKLNETNNVVVNLRNSTLDEYVDNKYIENIISKCEQILYTIKKSFNNELNIIVTYQVSGDKEFSLIIFNRLKNKFNVKFVPSQMNLDDVEKYYGKARYNISNRMHSLLLGYKFGALPIALIDIKEHIKITSAFYDSGLSELLIDVNSNTNGTDKIINNAEILYDRLIETEKINQALIMEKLNHITQ